MTRPASRSQGFARWNGAKLSFEMMTPPTSSAMLITSASPRPSVPAGGWTTVPAAMAASTRGRSSAATSWRRVASTTTWMSRSGCLNRRDRTAASSAAKLGLQGLRSHGGCSPGSGRGRTKGSPGEQSTVLPAGARARGPGRVRRRGRVPWRLPRPRPPPRSVPRRRDSPSEARTGRTCPTAAGPGGGATGRCAGSRSHR